MARVNSLLEPHSDKTDHEVIQLRLEFVLSLRIEGGFRRLSTSAHHKSIATLLPSQPPFRMRDLYFFFYVHASPTEAF